MMPEIVGGQTGLMIEITLSFIRGDNPPNGFERFLNRHFGLIPRGNSQGILAPKIRTV
jgi:hypothetical protein